MSATATPAKPPQHNPLVCGIYPESSCPACRTAWASLPAPQSLWHRLVGRFPLLARLTGAGVLSDYAPQPPPDDKLLVAVVALLADNDRRNIIMTAIAADVAAIAQAAGKRRSA